MTDDGTFELSRRKALAGLGTIGIASAGAGLGTSAFFSDREDFEGNTMVAGELDLLVDWTEHYSDWSDDEADGAGTVSMEPSTGLTGFPSSAPPEQQSVFVENPQAFLTNTAIESFPDTGTNGTADDGIQDTIPTDDECGYIRPLLRDNGNWISPLDSPARTDSRPDGLGGPPNSQVTAPGDPLIDIADVKPGDFGEVTFSLHLCGNPGYIWINGDLVSNAENSLTEPEAKDPDEGNVPGDAPFGDPDVIGDDNQGELLNEIRTRLWYDDGDNLFEDGEEPITPVLSLGELLLFLGGGNGIRLCASGAGVVVEPPDGAGDCGPKSPQSVHQSGDVVLINTPLTNDQDVEFTIPMNPKCTDFGLIQGLKIGPGEDDGELPSDGGSQTYSTQYGDIEVFREGETITDWNISGTDANGNAWCVDKVIVKGGNEGGNVYSYDNPNDGDDDGLDDYDDFTDDGLGANSHDGGPLATPTDQDISHVSFCLTPDTDDGNGGAQENGDCCFVNSTTRYVGFEWWLPVDHANEIQTDSVSFDLGFYTEQCRHNDGSGQPPEGSA